MEGVWQLRVMCITPELSRAAKRRRLGRIVRADVTAEAAEPQAATPRTKREPLTGSRVTRRPRLEKPKPERRPTEARTLASERATACTARRDDTRARTRRSTHALGGGAPALSEATRPKREAQRASHRPKPTQQKCENAERDAVAEAGNTGKLFPRPNFVMNRRLIVQFDPDEPSMSAPTFAEPDQGPLAGGRKVNARHDLTLGLWRRDCEISRGFPRR